MDEQQILSLKTQRTGLKSKITQLTTKIASALQRNKPLGEIESFIESLDDTYANFCEVHLLYSELCESESKYDEHKTVGGKDLLTYLNDVKSCYDQSVSLVRIHQNKDATNEIKTIVHDFTNFKTKCDDLLTQLQDLRSDIPSFPHIRRVLIEEYDIVIDRLGYFIAVLRKLSDYGDISMTVSEIDFYIAKLDKQVLLAKQLSHIPTTHPVLSESQKAKQSTPVKLNQSISLQHLTNPFLEATNDGENRASERGESPLPFSDVNNSPSASVFGVSAGIHVPTVSFSSTSSAGNVSYVVGADAPQFTANTTSVQQAGQNSAGNVSFLGANVPQFTANTTSVQQAGQNSAGNVGFLGADAPQFTPGTTSVQRTGQISAGNASFLGANAPQRTASTAGAYPNTQTVVDSVNSLDERQLIATHQPHQARTTPLDANRSPFHKSEYSITSAYDYNTRIADREPHPLTHGFQPQTHNRADTRFKKPPAPTFDGERRKWAEFRAIWEIYARSACNTEEERAWALKHCLSGKAADLVRAVLINQQDAYKRMWHRLDSHYSNEGMNIQMALSDLEKLGNVDEDDLHGLSAFIDSVELVYSHLGETNQLHSVSMVIIDSLVDRLPVTTKRDWMKRSKFLSPDELIHPFTPFMLFLEEERDLTCRLMERQSTIKKTSNKSSQGYRPKTTHTATHATGTSEQSHNGNSSQCFVHDQWNARHKTENCRVFLRLDQKDRYALVTRKNGCVKCLGPHDKKACDKDDNCAECGLKGHHKLLCRKTNTTNQQTDQMKEQSCHVKSHEPTTHSLFSIRSVMAAGNRESVNVFFDGGSNATYITNKAASRLKARKIKRVTLKIVTVRGHETEYCTLKYRVSLLTQSGGVESIIAYGMPQITNPIPKLDIRLLQRIFLNRTDLSELE